MLGCRLGLENTAIEPTARMLEIVMTPQLLIDLQTMERAVLDYEASRK
jgi:hypothetical protein